jgi:hypothetical protein
MIKIIRMVAMVLIVSVAVINVHATLNSFYGIKDGELGFQVWAQSSTDSSSTTTGGSGSTDAALFGSESTIGCVITVPITTSVTPYGNFNASGGATLTMKDGKIGGITLGSSGTISTTTSTVTLVYNGPRVTCNGWVGICFQTDCAYPVGTNPAQIISGSNTTTKVTGITTN